MGDTKSRAVKEGIRLNIGLYEKDMTGTIEVLNIMLADEHVLAAKTRKYSWNVIGREFTELRTFFEYQYGQLDDISNKLAMRTVILGGKTIGTLDEFRQYTSINEHSGEYPDSESMLADLLFNHETIIRNLRHDLEICDKKFGDSGTCRFLVDIMLKHEEMAYMLRAFLHR